MATTKAGFVLLMALSLHGNSARSEDKQSAVLERFKRQSGSFSQASYSFSPSTCTPGTLAGTTSAPGGLYFSIADSTPSQYLAISSTNGQVFLINNLTPGTPYTATIQSSPNGNRPLSVLGTSRITVTCAVGSGNNGAAPTPTQSSYTFTTSNCNAGVQVGSIVVSNPSNVVFTSATTGTPFAVSTTGLVTPTRVMTTGSQTIQVTMTNSFGTRTVPVTVTCTNGGTGGTGTGATFPVFTQTSGYTFTPTTCTAGAMAGSVAVNSPTGTTYALASAAAGILVSPTGMITFTGSPAYSSGSAVTFAVTATNSAGVSAVTVTIRPVCSGTGSGAQMQFLVPSYSFIPTGATCSAGAVVGTLSLMNAPGPVTYTIISSSAPGYMVNSAGQIIAATGVTSGTLQIQASSNGQTVTTSATINAAYCARTGTTGQCPVWPQSSYAFAFSSGCTMFTNTGVVAAQCIGGTLTYSMTNQVAGSINYFNIDAASGLIYVAVTNNRCNALTVTARSQQTGQTASIPVYVDCRSGAAPGTCTAAAAVGGCIVGSAGCADIG